MERIFKYIYEKKETAQLSSLSTWRKDAEETYAMYVQEYAVIKSSCPAVFETYDYFEADFLNTIHEQYHSIMFELRNLKEQWYVKHRTTQQTTGETQSLHISKLPEIKLVRFNGTYSKWPAFKKIFTSLMQMTQRCRTQGLRKAPLLV